MTNTPGEGQTPQDPNNEAGQPPPPAGPSQPSQEQPGYWQQHAQQPQPGQYPPQPGYYAPPVPMRYAPDHPKATTVLVLGILSVVLCQILGPFAWSMGKKTLAEIDAANGIVGGRGAAQAGYILGIVGTVLLGLAVLYIVGAVLFVGGVGLLASSTS